MICHSILSKANGTATILLTFFFLTTPMAYADTILIMGDSISAAYGIDKSQGWVALLQRVLDKKYPNQHRVINASVSGETTSGGKARLHKLLKKYQPDTVVIELGGNDGLRGLPPRRIQDNLITMVNQSKQSGADVVLLGMRIPPNYGSAYTQAFFGTFKNTARQTNIKYLPFFLDKVAGRTGYMQQDNVHPTAKAQVQLLKNAWTVIKPTLDD